MDESAQLEKLKVKITQAKLPSDVMEKITDELAKVEILLKNKQFSPDLERQLIYIDFVCSLPWDKQSSDILDIARAKQILDKNHFGLESVKDRVLEYLSVLILNKQKNQTTKSPVLCFVGLVGSGKTSLAYSIAEALGRQIVRIPFGGLGSASQLRGESRVKADAEAGLIIKALKRAATKNPVILLDELDRVTEAARADIMGVLVEILDPEQNSSFLDHYLDLPFDLSGIMFVATANNTSNISTAVMDRLELIEMPFYTDEQKIVIGRDFILPQAIRESGLPEGCISIDPSIWEGIVRPLGFDGGIRSLKRTIDSMVRKIALAVVEGKGAKFLINSGNLKEYIQ